MATTKRLTLRTAVPIIAIALCASASDAGIEPPVLEIDIFLDGEWAWGDEPEGEQVDESTFFYESSHTAATWEFEFTSLADPDPFVNNNTVITNTSPTMTQNFQVLVVLPIAPSLAAPTTIDGSAGVTLTDSNNDGSATLTSVTGGIYSAQIDGSTVQQLLTGAPYTLSVLSQGGNSVDNDAFGPLAGPAANASIGILLEFSLSPGDSVAITSIFEVVPAPGAMALLGMAGLIGTRRRRRGN